MIFNGELRHKSIKLVAFLSLSLLTALSLGLPLNNVNARRRPIHYRRRVHVRHRRRTHHLHHRIHRIRINHHYTTPYPTINDRLRLVNRKLKRVKHPKYHRETIKSVYGPRVTFKSLFFISGKVAGRNYLVQSLNVTPDGHYAYVGYGHNPRLKYGRNLTKVVKINVRTLNFKVSRAFNDGHGQALAYDPAKHALWLLEDHGGPIRRGRTD